MKLLSPVKKAVVFGHCHQGEYLEDIRRLLGQLSARGIDVWVERRFAGYLVSEGIGVAEDRMADYPPAGTGAAISIGGDGTFLRTARWIGRRGIPVLGINTGHLGFLAVCSPAHAEGIADMLAGGEAEVEERMALRVDVGEGGECPELPYALNEVAILKEDTASMINVNVEIDGTHLADYMADGVLISTPTGSTGYGLSVGGPIVFPNLNVMCLSPIAPHTLTLRPCVVGADSIIKARTSSRASRYRVSLDGVSLLLETGSEITIRRADFSPLVIRPLDISFAATLRRKLLWGVR